MTHRRLALAMSSRRRSWLGGGTARSGGAGIALLWVGTAGGALPDPCALLSRAEVTTLVGTPMPAPAVRTGTDVARQGAETGMSVLSWKARAGVIGVPLRTTVRWVLTAAHVPAWSAV